MIRTKDYIRCENVLSSRCAFHYSEMRKQIEKFLFEVEKTGARKKGPFMYALTNIPYAEVVNIEFFMPIYEEKISCQELQFHTYYSVEQMLSTYVFGNYENQMEMAYSALIEFMKQYQLEAVTPIYHVVDKEQRYIKVMIGYKNILQEIAHEKRIRIIM